ncbi:MAG: hypothetical protein HY534_05220, partial [Chloroflexi bacterium]|nr:hypothetical protein [Chloroflexota bacterium]
VLGHRWFLLIVDLDNLDENHTVAVFVNGSLAFYTLPGTLPGQATTTRLRCS